jgi:hypothetical protein
VGQIGNLRAGCQPNATYFVPVFRGARLRHCVRASAWTGVAFLTINDSGFLAKRPIMPRSAGDIIAVN